MSDEYIEAVEEENITPPEQEEEYEEYEELSKDLPLSELEEFIKKTELWLRVLRGEAEPSEILKVKPSIRVKKKTKKTAKKTRKTKAQRKKSGKSKKK